MFLNYIIYILTFLILFFSGVIIITRNPVHAAFSLISVFFFVGYLLYMLKMTFLALVIIILYAGAIYILFLFIIFTVNLDESSKIFDNITSKAIVFAFSLKFSISTLLSHYDTLAFDWYSEFRLNRTLKNFFFDASWLGTLLYNHYLLIFWVIGVLLCSAMINIIILTNPILSDNFNQSEEDKVINKLEVK